MDIRYDYTPFFVLILLIIIMIVCIRFKKLTFPAGLLAVLIGFLIMLGAGFPGLIMLGAFFIMGVLATAHKKELKGDHQQRTASQVYANGGMAAILATIAMFYPEKAHIHIVMMAGSLASATADTLSSELGMVYGRNFYNIISFKRDTKGLDGVVSLEGTLLGTAGAIIIAVIYGIGYAFDYNCVIIVIAGITGNLADSVLGATLERKQKIGNDVVNFLNTLIAAFVAAILYYL